MHITQRSELPPYGWLSGDKMGLLDKFKKKRDQWKKEKRDRELMDTGYKMAYNEEYKKEMQNAMQKQISKNAREAAREDIKRRYPGKSKKNSRGGVLLGLDAAFRGATASMGLGQPLDTMVSKQRKKKRKYPQIGFSWI